MESIGDHTADLLRLSRIRVDLQQVRASLVRAITAHGNRAVAQRVKENLTVSDNFIKYTAALLQPRRDDGIAEREALQL